LTSHLHKVKAVKDDLGLRKELARSALISRTRIHANKCDLFGPSPVGYQRLGEGFQSAAAFDHQEKFMRFGVQHIGRACPQSGAGTTSGSMEAALAVFEDGYSGAMEQKWFNSKVLS
jgi:hypothetical protein